MNNSVKGKISPSQLFFIIFVSRSIVALTFIQSVSVGKLHTDVIVSFCLSYLIAILMSAPVILCIKKGTSPLNNKTISLIYSVYYLLFSSLGASRFAYFSITKLNPQMSMIIFIALVFAAVCYGAYLGIEALGRFASFCGVILIIAVLAATVINGPVFNVLNLFPVFENSKKTFISNMVIFTSNTMEPAILLALHKKTNGNSIKPYVLGISCAYFSVLMLLLFTVGVLGEGASIQAFPIFTLFQMIMADNMARLDIIHTAFWIFAVYLKSAVLVYCAALSLKKYSHKKKVIIISAVGFLLSAALNEFVGPSIVDGSKIVSVALYVGLVIIVPFLSLITRKEHKGEEH